MGVSVTLLTHTPNPEKVIAMAARLCYSKLNVMDLDDQLTKEKCIEMINKVSDMGHTSILEHVYFTFAISGVSRIITQQLTRHRIATFHQRSQRYVEESNALISVPPSINASEEAMKVYEECARKCNDSYKKLVDLGVPKEDARFVLMNGTESQLIMTMNARELIHFLNLRLCTRAQWEIREIAEQILYSLRKVLPVVFNKVGPSCFEGACPEGCMSCGKVKEQREKYDPTQESYIEKFIKERQPLVL